MAIHSIPTNFDTPVANEAGRHATPVALPPGQETDELYWGEDGLSFGDVVDVVNPLHHLPVVGTAYRELTGDQIAPAAKIIGGMIFGGPIGMVLAIFNAIFEEATGDDIGGAVADLFNGDSDDPESRLAEAGTAPAESQGAAAQTVAMAPAAAPVPDTSAATPTPDSLPQLAPAGGAPQLSPAAFDALVRSFNGPIARTDAAPAVAPAPAAPAARSGIAAGAEVPRPATDNALPSLVPVGKPIPLLKRSDSTAPAHDDRRQAALDLHQQLRAYAEDKGVRVAAVPTR